MFEIKNAMNDTSTPSSRNWKRLCWAASCLALAGICLAKAIPASPNPAQAEVKAASVASLADKATALPTRQLPHRTKSIEAIRVGDRVLGENPQLNDKDRSLVDPDPATWRRLELCMTKKDGKRLDMVLLRPLVWVKKQKAHVGGSIQLDFRELGAVGEAAVLALGPCPSIAPGRGAVVTATFVHEADDNLVDVLVDRLAEPITCTANHPFWSEDRQKFVQAEGLANLEYGMRQSGSSLEEIARAMHAERRALGIKYKDLTSADLLEKIYQRNMERYGDRLGPSIEFLLGKGKPWEQIIESAMTPGGADLGLGR